MSGTIFHMLRATDPDGRRAGSPTRGNLSEVFLGPVPVRRAVGQGASESERMDPFGDQIAYDWAVRHE